MANGTNIKKDGRGQDIIKLTMAETVKQDSSCLITLGTMTLT